MGALLQHIVENRRLAPGVTLVVGAGHGADLPAIRGIGGRRLVLVEAHPQQAEALARRIQPERDEEVWPLAITPDAVPRATLQVLNSRQHSSLRVPQALLQHAPNLRVVGQVEVPACSLAEALERLGPLSAAENHTLILDAPGLNLELLRATPAAALHAFAWILVHGGASAELYAGDGAIEEAAAWLGACGFDRTAEDPEALYPHTALLLARNDHQVRILGLEGQIAELRARLDRADETTATLIAARDAETRLVAEHQTQLDQLRATLAERLCQLEALTAEKATLAKDQTDLTGQLERAHKAAAERLCQLEALTAEKAALIKDRTELTGQLEQAQKAAAERLCQLEALTAEKAALIKDKAELTGQLEQAQKAAAERQRQLEALTVEKATLAKDQADLTGQLEQAQKAAAERLCQLEALTAEKAALIKDKTDMTGQLEQAREAAAEHQHQQAALTAEKAALIKDKTELSDQLEQAQKGAAEQRKQQDILQQQITEKTQRLQQLEAENNEIARRQELLQEELIKAEAQIDLIKDLLLREPQL